MPSAAWYCRAYDPDKGRGCGSLMHHTPGGWACPKHNPRSPVKILVIHSQQPANQYAGGDDGLLDSEQYRMRPLASRIVDGLRAAGHDAHLGPLGTSYRDNVAWCNKVRGDLILSCHSNATGTANRGTGALIGIGSNRARPAAEAIAAELGKVVPGGASITDAAWIKVAELVDTYDPALLVEYYWHDQPDQAQWIRDNWPAMADATVRGLVAKFGGTIATPLTSTSPRTPLLKVDGLLGPATYGRLQGFLGVPKTGKWDDATRRKLQRYLNVTADGVFGPVSTRALQRLVGASVDGQWGPRTTTALQVWLNSQAGGTSW